MNATFEISLVTNFDEVTGDYYPYMEMYEFYLDLDPDNVEVVVDGGSPEQHDKA